MAVSIASRVKALSEARAGVVKETSYLGFTVQSRPCERETCFARLDRWLPNVDLHKFDEEEGKRELLPRHLGCYGPVSIQDFAYWADCWQARQGEHARISLKS